MTFLCVVLKVLVCAAFMGVLAIFFRANGSGVRLGLGLATAHFWSGAGLSRERARTSRRGAT